ncbi:MAG: MBL fold metallo-hydrolase [bacterium]|nr:MBL fold metallo-hydrolase [bacterium]
MKIKVVYDNKVGVPGLVEDWGFACLIESGSERILFDTGAEGEILIDNMRRMNIPPTSIERIVISHDDWDHAGGLSAILDVCDAPQVHVLPSFDRDLLDTAKRSGQLAPVDAPGWLTDKIWSTGPLPRINPVTETGDEQALAIKGRHGFLLLTGCAHPGLINLVQHCRKELGSAPRMIMGGLHLKDLSNEEVTGVIAELRGMGVARIAPCHCTGAEAMRQLGSAYCTNYVESAVGEIIEWP